MDLNTDSKMLSTMEALDNKLLNIRAGRANPAMLNGIMVDYYGTPTPINSILALTSANLSKQPPLAVGDINLSSPSTYSFAFFPNAIIECVGLIDLIPSFLFIASVGIIPIHGTVFSTSKSKVFLVSLYVKVGINNNPSSAK